MNLRKILWAIFLFTLPITSFPFFPPAIGGEALVRPLSLYPLALLISVFVLPRLFNRPLPKTFQPLLLFFFAATASSLLSLLYGVESAMDVSIAQRVVRGEVTLLVGCAFYLAAASLPDSIAELRYSLRWIYAGCALAMTWGTIQASHILNFNPAFFEWMSKVQGFISTRRLLIGRISGMTYEPHWFADQLILLVLPGVLAAVLSKHTIFRWRKGWLTVEWLLLGWVILLLPFTYSRAGLLNLLVTILISVFLFSRGGFAKRVSQVVMVALVIAIPIVFIGVKNEFFARIWEYWRPSSAASASSQTITNYFVHLGLDTRLAYGEAAYNTYAAHPWSGVGLGNFGFFIQEMLPLRPVPGEVLRVITPDTSRTRLVTPKNFYLRLLAETGVLGTFVFSTFLIAILGNALYLIFSPHPEWQYWGKTALIGIIAFLISALTFDSYAIPNMWIVFGLTTAASGICATYLPNQLLRQQKLSTL